MSKQEATDVSHLITDYLVNQLNYKDSEITNDKTIGKYTKARRPDLLISSVPYKDGNNDEDFVNNLLCYAEAKDHNCKFNDSAWKNAYNQCLKKAPELHMPFFGVTNCRNITRFYNLKTKHIIKVNGHILKHFVDGDMFRAIKRTLINKPKCNNIKISSSSDSITSNQFHMKLEKLKKIYRDIDFGNSGITAKKINFTIGMIALEFYEEKSKLDKTYNSSNIYWSDSRHAKKSSTVVANLTNYIDWLSNKNTRFKEFKPLLSRIKHIILSISHDKVKAVYNVIDSMRPLHGAGFDLFGSVYQMFANAKEKKDFGQYFTPRQYAYVFAQILLRNELTYNPTRLPSILDPFCGTGGMLTESFRALKSNYIMTNTFCHTSANFLAKNCFYGIDITNSNIFRTRLNMFLIGDGHTNMYSDNSFNPEKPQVKKVLSNHYQYIITNPPYGNGNTIADTSVITSKREEIASLCLIIERLAIDGHACVILPIGFFENPTFTNLRKEVLKTCTISAIISLPAFAFVPYTKEKTYAMFITKRSSWIPRNKMNDKKKSPVKNYQTQPIWMYIIDNDGFSNSDKHFKTNLRNKDGSWKHDEVQGYIDDEGRQRPSLLEQRWENYDDHHLTPWIDETGHRVKKRKAKFINISNVKKSDFFNIMPEHYLRPQKSQSISKNHFNDKLNSINKALNDDVLTRIFSSIRNMHKKISHDTQDLFKMRKQISYQKKNIALNNILTYIGGNQGLTQQFIYSQMNLLSKGVKCKVLSSSTKGQTNMGVISSEAKSPTSRGKIKTFRNKCGILVARNGRAGSSKYLAKGNYTITDHAYILYLKPNIKYNVNLKWLYTFYKNRAYDFSSASNNGTWHVRSFLNDVTINIPKRKFQDRILSCYDDIHKQCHLLRNITKKINTPYQKLMSYDLR